MSDETMEEKVARLREEKRARDAKRAEEDQAFDLQELELDARMEAELGRRGVDWAMVSDRPTKALVVVKRGHDLAFRKYIDAVHAADDKGVSAADLFEFVGPCVVVPDQASFADLVRRHGFVSNRAANAVASLHGVRGKAVEGKF